MSALTEFAALLASDARVAWHRSRRDAHARALAAAQARQRDRVVAWTGRDPDDPAEGP